MVAVLQQILSVARRHKLSGENIFMGLRFHFSGKCDLVLPVETFQGQFQSRRINSEPAGDYEVIVVPRRHVHEVPS